MKLIIIIESEYTIVYSPHQESFPLVYLGVYVFLWKLSLSSVINYLYIYILFYNH